MNGSLSQFPALEVVQILAHHDAQLRFSHVFGSQRFELSASAGRLDHFGFNGYPYPEANAVSGFVAAFGALRRGSFEVRHTETRDESASNLGSE
jgi:hypothetical protein